MTHDSHHSHGAEPTQAIFVGWFAVAMLVVMALFTVFVLGSAATTGFS